MMASLGRWGFALAGILLALTASSGADATEPKVLRRWNQAEPETLDPQKSTGIQDVQVEQDLYEGLTIWDVNKHPAPGIAERWDVSPDGLTYVFHLRHGVKWSNGDPVTSADFLYSFRRLVDPKTAAGDIDAVRDIVNAEAINAGKEKDLSKLGVEAPDPYTFTIHLAAANLVLPELMTQRFVYPLHRATIEAHPSDWTRPGVAVTDGPYLLKSWVPHDQIVLVKNPGYYNAAAIAIDEVDHVVSDDDGTALKRYLSGDLDITRVPTRQLIAIRKDYPEELKTGIARSTYYMPINLRRAPLGTDVRLREALAMTIDRETLVNKIIVRGQQPSYSFTPEVIGSHGYEPQKFRFAGASLADRITRAKELMAEAGYGPDHPLKLTISYTTNDEIRSLMTAIASMWKTSLGVEVTLDNQEFQVLLSNLRRQNFEIASIGFQIDFDDPVQYLRINQTDAGDFNSSAYANPAYDALIRQARVALDWPSRNALSEKAERILMDDVPMIPLFSYANNYMVKPRVAGWRNNEADAPTRFLAIRN
ncbi:peptide ABC transporter substrate-binding protein [Aliidongia dinghuensis]|uniref:Peptide ABC transporter substrate-binding protein n=1 Tax=Aliidongia dinghuensis TaxID=1867774 RepID=A0A8J2YQN3_9PROT|nr:peptide ABC transporter substrate-binding protein [Aliidongia dinghuensis]GGF09109.1 peptide ABC transporter substrate-binding protein [Aliidongia dinghuensis]